MNTAFPEDFARIESDLFRRLKTARLAYERAKAHAASLHQMRDLGLNFPNEFIAIREAVLTEDAALEDYDQALRAFTEFVLGPRL